ncbi:hypothetical protein ACHAXT_013227 [Thalassiosira profunda]
MPISEKAQRAWKAGTAVVTAWTAWYGLFHIDYGSHEHCFSDIQRWYRRKVDELLGIDLRAAKQIAADRERENEGALTQQSISGEGGSNR